MMQWPPFAIEKVTYYNYVLDADMGALQRLCDAFFGGPSEGKVVVKPLLPVIVFSYANIEEATCSDPAAGSTPEKDILLWTPVVRLDATGTRVEAVPVFSPFVFVDNATAVSLGREMFGFPKAWCALPSHPDGPGSKLPIHVKAYTKPADQPVLAPRTIFELTASGPGGPIGWVEGVAAAVEEILRVAKQFLRDDDGLGPVLNAEALAVATASLLEKSQPFIFLKQFPAMGVSGACCYQAIGQMQTTLGSVERFGVLPFAYQLTYVDDMFHHFAESFGWSAGPLPVRAAFFMDFSFTLVSGEVLWQPPTT